MRVVFLFVGSMQGYACGLSSCLLTQCKAMNAGCLLVCWINARLCLWVVFLLLNQCKAMHAGCLLVCWINARLCMRVVFLFVGSMQGYACELPSCLLTQCKAMLVGCLIVVESMQGYTCGLSSCLLTQCKAMHMGCLLVCLINARLCMRVVFLFVRSMQGYACRLSSCLLDQCKAMLVRGGMSAQSGGLELMHIHSQTHSKQSKKRGAPPCLVVDKETNTRAG